MKVTEIFYGIEGEGIEIGRPQIFVRLAGCNLRCTWCDTKYSWENGEEMSLKEILKRVAKYYCKNVSITGGEPLLQEKELLELVRNLKRLSYWININTNGTLFDEEIFRLTDLISMDCKCPSSEMKSDYEVLRKTKELFNHKTQFKFIISNEEDYEHAKKIVSSLLLDATNIVFQPEWSSKKFAQTLTTFVKKDNINAKIILQQQKIIWGIRRGV